MLENNFVDDAIWGLFVTTGNIGYYNFFQALGGNSEGKEKDIRE